VKVKYAKTSSQDYIPPVTLLLNIPIPIKRASYRPPSQNKQTSHHNPATQQPNLATTINIDHHIQSSFPRHSDLPRPATRQYVAVRFSTTWRYAFRRRGGGAGLNSSTLYNCSLGSFDTQCARFRGQLVLVFLQGTGTPLPPQMGTFLTQLNLSAIVDVGRLSVIVGNALGAVTQNLSPVFLTSLKFVRGDFTVTDATTVTPRLLSLPGLTNLLQVAGTFTVSGTAFANMTSVSGLECVSGDVVLGGNINMTTLAGLERLSSVGASLGSTVTAFNTTGGGGVTPLASPASLLPLTAVARCAGGTSPLTQPVSIQVTGCTAAFATWTKVCAYIQSGTC
jgi:hypothetical protein